MDFAKLHTDVAFKRANGKIIWQPRIGCWYYDKLYAGQQLPEEYRGLSLPDIYRKLGCSARPYVEYNKSIVRIEHPSVKKYSRALNETDTEYITETPVGKLTEIGRKVDKVSRELKVKWRICDENDLKVATWLEQNCSWGFDQKAFDEAQAEWGDLSAPTIYMPRINVQALYINDMGVEEAVYAIYDYPDEVNEYLKAMDENHMRLIKDVINPSPIDIINFGDNLHCGTLPPDMFEEFIMPAYHERTAELHKAGKFVSAHWDGDTKNFLKYAQQTGLDAIEAITPKPQGDVELEEVREALGDKMFLLDGVAAVLFDPEYTEDQLLEQAEKVIKLFAPNLIMGISDEISYTGDIERVKAISKLVDKYNKEIEQKNNKA